MEKLRKTNGITLIALIITIVVLIILAGVVIIALNGNGGILNNANKAAEKYNSKASEEEELLGTLENKLKEYTGENSDKPTKEPTNVEYFSWTTTETEATITGFSDAGKAKYNAGEITELVIPSEYNGLVVTEIGSNAFSKCSGITNINIPSSVTKIGTFAFLKCTGLTELYIPKTLQEVGRYIDNTVFYGCTGISKVEFEEGTTKIIDNILCNAKLKSGVEIIIPSSVTEIGSSAFSGCSGITNINIPSSVTKIGIDAFTYCTGLTELFIPKTLQEVGRYINNTVFYGCTGISKVEFEEGTTKIIDNILCNAKLKSGVEIIIPSSVTEIGSSAFSGCSGITNINIPSSVTEIGSSAFSECSGITNINIPSSVTKIGTSAFTYCTGLTELYIPKTLQEVGRYIDNTVFYGCTGISKVEFEEGTTKIIDNILCNAKLKSGAKIIIPSSVTEIGSSAFYNCNNLTTVNFRGTEAQWNAISIGSSNDPLTSATKQFNQ